jgi:hypothetical protein
VPRTKATVPRIRLNLFITQEAAEQLANLAPAHSRRGEYISELIMRAARERGLVEGEAGGEVNGELAEMQHQLAALQAEFEAFKRRKQGASGDTP